jgi:regulator of protease activity HflC (stomatin/prohibitin superfamily)
LFDRIYDWIDRGWGYIRPWFVVDVYETVALLRVGRFKRACPPGLHWKIPFFDHPIEITTCLTTVRLPAQPLTTKDDVAVTVQAIIKYSITDVEKYITQIFDQNDVLCDVTMGAIRRHTAESNYKELLLDPPEQKVTTHIRREAKKYGFEVDMVTFTAFTRSRPITLIQQTVLKDLAN